MRAIWVRHRHETMSTVWRLEKICNWTHTQIKKFDIGSKVTKITNDVFYSAVSYRNQETPTLAKYFFASRDVLNFGNVAMFSDSFDVFDAKVWKLHIAFKAYSKIFPGTVVNHMMTDIIKYMKFFKVSVQHYHSFCAEIFFFIFSLFLCYDQNIW